MSNILRRYTELPFVIDLLHSRELTLLSPKLWDDKNDSHYMDVYAARMNCDSIYALCLTEASETYHHWKIFSQGSGGICLEIKKDALLESISKVDGLVGSFVQYRTLDQIRNDPPAIEALPLLKRFPFADEREFRLFLLLNKHASPFFRFHLPISSINRVVLSPWLPKGVAKNVKASLKSIPGCKSLKIYRSSLVDNASWKEAAKGRVK